MKSVAYEAVYNQIIESMSKGEIPWRKSWTGARPRNGSTGRGYHGINFLLLSISGFSDPRWFTYNQITALGGTVKKGEKSRQIVFWQILNKKDDEGKSKNIPLLKYFNVFNYEQTEGLALPALPNEVIVEAEEIVDKYVDKPETSYGFSYASYVISKDLVRMPSKNQFTTVGEFYSTLFHEYAHSTGHENRLNRKTLKNIENKTDYSEEELVAELTSAFLCAQAGIDNTLENSSAYIQGWMKQFKENPEMIIHASSKAQKAADYILGLKNQEAVAE